MSNLCTTSISNTYIQQAVIITPFFCKRIKRYLLNPMDTRRHINSENLSALAGYWKMGLISFPFGQHPLQDDRNRIGKRKIRFGGPGIFGMSSIKNPISCKVRMKGKTSEPGIYSGLGNEVRLKAGEIQKYFWLT